VRAHRAAWTEGCVFGRETCHSALRLELEQTGRNACEKRALACRGGQAERTEQRRNVHGRRDTVKATSDLLHQLVAHPDDGGPTLGGPTRWPEVAPAMITDHQTSDVALEHAPVAASSRLQESHDPLHLGEQLADVGVIEHGGRGAREGRPRLANDRKEPARCNE
jgi:hypothetical protein